MTTAVQLSPRTAAIPVHAVRGAAAGLVGGIGMGIWMSVSTPMADTSMITMVAESRPRVLGARSPQIALTHEQIAALAGTSRETTTKVLRDYADQGLIHLARGRITVLDTERLNDQAG